MSNSSENVMNKLAELLTGCSPDMNKNILREQLIDFAGKWNSLSKTLLEEYICLTLYLEKEEESDAAEEHHVNKWTCKNCIFCCY